MIKIINSLLKILILKKIIHPNDKRYFINILMAKMQLKNFSPKESEHKDLLTLQNAIGNYAEKKFGINKADFINEIMSLLIDRPSEVQRKFEHDKKTNVHKAFLNYYALSQDSYYIKPTIQTVSRNFFVKTSFGKLEITVNQAKPEKTQEQIKLAMKKTQTSYPKCALCLENEGFSLNKNKPAKQTLRILRDVFNNKKFFMHFSPYQYYNHHLIVNSWEHSPLKINLETLEVLFDFVEKYKFYSLGTNGDIPIVGGSILSHLHFQGGKGNFPIFDADFFYSKKFSSVNLQLLKWPVSTIKISSNKPKEIIKIAFKIIDKWYKYQNKGINIFNTYSLKSRNNAVNLFARWEKNKYELYILLRNNFTTSIFPNGIFNFRKETWNIKKENIGIIEVLGKAILPGRLEKEIAKLVNFCWKALDIKAFPKSIKHHKQWYENTLKNINFESKKDCEEKIWNEVGYHFLKGLNQCGVFSGHQKEFIEFFKDI